MPASSPNLIKSVKVSILLVYCVIVAGALVRMTGSGMGCPDWPKCFGYYIPPTDVEQLTWRPGKTFEAGQVIIRNDSLWVAREAMTTTATYDPSQWRHYTKHDYAIFNPTHTWVEYLNRLTGALAGIAVLVTAVMTLRHRRLGWKVPLLGWLTVFLMGFQAWLGATVVYSVLNPVKITLHMLVALLIVALLIYLLQQARGNITIPVSRKFRNITLATILLSLVQIAAGTQLRQFVDTGVKAMGLESIDAVLTDVPFVFYFHRSFSIAVVLVTWWLWKANKELAIGFCSVRRIVILVVLEVLTGVAMVYAGFPFGTQAAHLVFASLLFGLEYDLWLKGSKKADR